MFKMKSKQLINKSINHFYTKASEETRLDKGMGLFEFERTKTLIPKIKLEFISWLCSAIRPETLLNKKEGIVTKANIIAKYLGLLNLVVIEKRIGEISISPKARRKEESKNRIKLKEFGVFGINSKTTNDIAETTKPKNNLKNEFV